MSDLIDRQKAIDAIMELQPYSTKRELINRIESSIADAEGYLGGIAMALDEIEDLPSVEAVEVKHGRWLRGSSYPHHIFCSVCYATYIPNDEIPLWKSESYFNVPRNYCPYCGARMEHTE